MTNEEDNIPFSKTTVIVNDVLDQYVSAWNKLKIAIDALEFIETHAIVQVDDGKQTFLFNVDCAEKAREALEKIK